jgi:hypothetical protein
LGQQIQKYIIRWDTVKAEYEAAEGKIDITIEMSLFIRELQQIYSKEAYSEIAKQKKLDIELLRQALIRFANFEKE